MATKQCTKCGAVKDIEQFLKGFRRRSPLCISCKVAVKEEKRAYYRMFSPAVSVAVTEKACTKCQEVKPSDLFSRNKKTRDGLASWCKACVAAKTKKNRENPEVKLRDAAYAKTEKVKAWRRQYQKSAHGKSVIKKNEQSPLGRIRRARVKARRRMLEKDAPATLTLQEWQEVLAEHGNACCFCRRAFTDRMKPEQDHIIPLSKGGWHVKSNIQPACRHCNASKRDRNQPVTMPPELSKESCS